MTKIRESLRQHKQPRVMEKQKRKIGVDWENEINNIMWFKEKEGCKRNGVVFFKLF